MKAQTGGVKIYLHFIFDLGAGWGWFIGPRKRELVPILQETVRAPGPVWMDAESLVLTGARFLNRPARSESLYGLRYPGTLASYFISNKVVDGGNILFVDYYNNKRHNGVVCAVYLVVTRPINCYQPPSFTDVVRHPRYRSDSVLN